MQEQEKELLFRNVQVEVNNPTLRYILKSVFPTPSSVENDGCAEKHYERVGWRDYSDYYADWSDWSDWYGVFPY